MTRELERLGAMMHWPGSGEAMDCSSWQVFWKGLGMQSLRGM